MFNRLEKIKYNLIKSIKEFNALKSYSNNNNNKKQ